MKGGNIRLMVVDDQQSVRAHIDVVTRATSDITIIGTAGDGVAGVAGVQALRPDVVLLDVRMPGLDGVAAARAIAADTRLSDVRIVMLSGPGEERRVFEALMGAAAGFVSKARLGQQLVEVIRCVVRGSALPTPVATAALITSVLADLPADLPMRGAVASLTDRERDVVRCVAAGLPNHQIATIFGLGPTTMYAYVRHISTKLAARERMQVAVAAYTTGLIGYVDPEPVATDWWPAVDGAARDVGSCRRPGDRAWPDRDLNTSTRWM